MSAVRTVGRWLKKTLGYGLVFLLAFGVTLYYSFPYEVIGDRVLASAEEAIGARVEVDSLAPYWITGLSAESVTLTFPATKPGKEDFVLTLEQVRVRLKPLASLFGSPTAAVAIALGEGKGAIEGDVSLLDENRINAVLAIQSLALGELGSVWDKVGLGFAGNVSGELDLVLPQNLPTALDGGGRLEIAGAQFGGGMIKGFTVPGMDLGTFELNVTAEKGKLDFVPPLEIDGKDLAAEIAGSIELRPLLATSRGDLQLRFKPTDAFWKANATLAGLAKAMLEGAKDKDDYYAYDLSGPLGRPNFAPHREGRTPPRKKR
ncbi:MAG: type II secretion system protein GspN [Deltaproteobacteria bacterium]|nr:type II secretion system protein GspN [Deltaproteobacteria bacterium]